VVETPPLAFPEEDVPPSRLHHGLELLKDNIEAFTVALIMALVIKHFCVEAFKIPTESMYPTLYGERKSPQHIGDRILVDKWAYLLSGPERWDVIVFRYPLNWSKHFIKRVAGVGPEWIKTARGDLWTRADESQPWRIATKRRRVREELYLPVYPPTGADAEQRWSDGLVPAPSAYWDADPAWEVLDHTTLHFSGGERARVSLRKRIGRLTGPQSYDMESDGELVRDVRFQATLAADAPATVWLRWWMGEDRAAELRLAAPGDAEGSRLRVTRGEQEAIERALDVGLAPGRPARVELECVDGQVYVHVDGREVVHVDEERHLDELRGLGDFKQGFELEARGGAVRVEGLRADRDVHYGAKTKYALDDGGEGVFVPDGHYFMLGDNTDHSSDSRAWELTGVVLEDGKEIWFEANESDNRPTQGPDGLLHVVDQDGIERRWSRDAEDHRETKDMPFVARHLIVGRAFFIFWPLLPDFPNRAGFIH